MHEDDADTVYQVDAALHLEDVGGAWARFAHANDAPDLAIRPPIGRHLLDAVADDTTRQLYVRLFHRASEVGRAVMVPFRCDAPDRRRFMELWIHPRPHGGYRVIARTRREETRAAVSLLRRELPRRAGKPLRICGWCKAVQVRTRWVEVEEAVATLELFDGSPIPALSHGICPTCLTSIEAAIDGV